MGEPFANKVEVIDNYREAYRKRSKNSSATPKIKRKGKAVYVDFSVTVAICDHWKPDTPDDVYSAHRDPV